MPSHRPYSTDDLVAAIIVWGIIGLALLAFRPW